MLVREGVVTLTRSSFQNIEWYFTLCQRSCEWNVQKSKLAFFLFPCRMVTFNKYLKQKTKKKGGKRDHKR